VVASWLEGDGVAISEFPKVAEHYRRMLARPGVQQGLAL
jgi:glutathione S-transferase